MKTVSETAVLTCPKCGADMRSYERNGVVVDQCTECRGVFLDRGELERLVEAEGSYYGERGSEPRPDERYEGSKKKSRKRSFLENLFEGGD
jgi:Zn-finger nucleic acid-binding protein